LEDFRSISGTMLPDFFLRIRRGNQTKAFVLNAKYRTVETSNKESLDDFHVYKNGLRYIEKTVCGAFIPVPAYESKVEGYFTNEYRNQYHFGGFRLHPTEEDDAELLQDWLKKWMETMEP
jgi:hypothetical protein